MLDEPKYWISIVVGILVVALGGIPLLQGWGLIPFPFPPFLAFGINILLWIVAAVGAYLLIDSLISEDDTMMWVSVGVAVIILGIAIIQILNNFGIIGFGIPFLSLTILRVLFVIEGLGLILAGFGSK